jgi:hypothetical protein
MEETYAEIKLQRSRVVIHTSNPEFLLKSPIRDYLTVWDFKRKRYLKDMKYALINAQTGDMTLPRSVNIQRLSRRLSSFGCHLGKVYSDEFSELVPFSKFSQNYQIQDNIKIRDEFQDGAINFLCNPVRDNMHVRLLSLPTGYGKTFCALWASCYYGMKTLIVVSSLTQQWIREIINKTTIPPKRIYEIAESIDSVNHLLSNSVTKDTYDIYVASIRTLANAQEQGLYVPLLKKLGIGLKIVDEFHVATYTNNKLDLETNVMETIYLTATSGRSNSAEHYTYNLAFGGIPTYGTEILDFAQKYLHTIWVMYDTKPTYHENLSCSNQFGFNTVKYARQIWSELKAPILINIIKWAIDLLLQYIASDEKIVIIVELKETATFLVKTLKFLYPNIRIGEYTSNISQKEKGANLQNTIIVSTNESFGTGQDLRGKLRALINTITYNSKITAKQLPGRLRFIPGKAIYYIDLVNQGYGRVIEHYKNRRKIIDKFSKEILVRTVGEDI